MLTRSEIFDGLGYGGISVLHGSLNIVVNFNDYILVDERNGEIIRTGA